MPVRVAILTNIPAPYRLSFFRELSRHCDLNVIFDARSEPNRAWNVSDNLGFRHSYVRGAVIPYIRRRSDGPSDERYLQIRYGTLPALARFRPDVVVSAELGLRSLQAAVYCRVKRIPMLLWSEGTPHSEGWAGWKKVALRRLLVKRATRHWCNGLESAALLESYGAKLETLDTGMTGIETARLGEDVAFHRLKRDEIRAELGAEGSVFLFSGQLVARKGVKELLAALEPLSVRGDEFTVLLLGDGDEKSLVRQWAVQHPQVRVRLLGFRQPERVAEVYAAADFFVLPTLDDNWSLVALEAAVAGLPQLFSIYNGATADLMAAGAAGLAFDPYDALRFSEAIRECLDGRVLRAGSEVADSLIDFYGPERFAARAWRSIQVALKPDASGSGPATREKEVAVE